MSALIDEIYAYTGLVFSDSRAKDFQKLIDDKLRQKGLAVDDITIERLKETVGYLKLKSKSLGRIDHRNVFEERSNALQKVINLLSENNVKKE